MNTIATLRALVGGPRPPAGATAPPREARGHATQVRDQIEATAVAPSPIRLRIHDASRVEWDVTLPLPFDRKLAYELVAELEVPAGAAVRDAPWDRLQALTRLDGSTKLPTSDDVTVDALRRGAVTLTRMLRRAKEGFARACRAAVEGGAGAGGQPTPSVWLEVALRSVRDAREKLCRGGPRDPPLVAKERRLADEFASVRLLDLLAEADAAVRGPASLAAAPGVRAAFDALGARVADATAEELAHRRARGWAEADERSPESLDRWVARAARLKKHFEEVLFLDRESEQLDERVTAWSRVLGAMLGGIVAMVPLQLFLSRHQLPRVGWGVAALALLTGLTYALREHVTGRGSSWVRGKMARFHTERVLRCRVPARRLATRDVLVEAREWCRQVTRSRPDPLNPEAGASQPVTRIRYEHRGVVRPHADLWETGVRRVLHLFRYDLSPLLPRLDDATKRVPVRGADGRPAFAAAPRRYQVPIAIALVAGGERCEERATLVLDRGGLRRIDPAADA